MIDITALNFRVYLGIQEQITLSPETVCAEGNVDIMVDSESVGIRMNVDVKFPFDQVIATELEQTVFRLFVQAAGGVNFV